MKRAFLDKILARLRRIQPEEVEAFFVELARDNVSSKPSSMPSAKASS
jgi:hypothetical protein